MRVIAKQGFAAVSTPWITLQILAAPRCVVARPLAPAAAGPAPGQRRVVVIDGLNVARAQGYREPGFDYEKYLSLIHI